MSGNAPIAGEGRSYHHGVEEERNVMRTIEPMDAISQAPSRTTTSSSLILGRLCEVPAEKVIQFLTFQSTDSGPRHLILKGSRSHHPEAGSDDSDCSLRSPDTVSGVL